MSKEELLQVQLFLTSSLEKPFASSATMWSGSAGHVEGNPYTSLVKRGQAARGQGLSQQVNNQVCHVLRAGTQLEDRQKLGAGINRQPEPLHLRMAAQPRAQQWSSCRCGSQRWQKDRSCKVWACSQARVNQVVIVA